MKKALLLMLTVALSITLLVMPVLGANVEELSEYGQTTITPHYLETAPIMDGEITEGEYGEAIHTLVYDANDKTQYWTGIAESDDFKLEDVLPEEAVLYMGFDAENLYIAAYVKDENHFSPNEGLDVWDGDYLEIDLGFNFGGTVDHMLDRNRIAFGLSGSGTPFGYAATVPSYAKFTVNAELPGYSVIRDDDEGTTVYEATLSWNNLTGKDEVPEKGFFMYQFGTAHSQYANLSDYNAYLGAWRYAALIPAGVLADNAKMGLHMFTIDKSVLPAETETSTEETSTEPETSTEAPATEPDETTTPDATTAPDAAGTETTDVQTEGTSDHPDDKTNTAIGIILGVAAALIVVIVVVAVILLKKKK